jgi:hypothetical protein
MFDTLSVHFCKTMECCSEPSDWPDMVRFIKHCCCLSRVERSASWAYSSHWCHVQRFGNYTPYISSFRANVDKTKIELLKAEAPFARDIVVHVINKPTNSFGLLPCFVTGSATAMAQGVVGTRGVMQAQCRSLIYYNSKKRGSLVARIFLQSRDIRCKKNRLQTLHVLDTGYIEIQ